MPRTTPALLALALLPAAVTGCSDPGAAKAGGDPKGPARALLVRTTRPEPARLERTLDITGEVIALRWMEVQARLGGLRIVDVPVDVGSAFSEGEVLVQLEDVTLLEAVEEREVDVREAESKLEDARLALKELEAERRAQEVTLAQKVRVFERAKAQAAQGAIADEALDLCRYEHEAAVAQEARLAVQAEKGAVAVDLAAVLVERAKLNLARAQRELAYAKVTAPFDGVVHERRVNPGQITTANQTLLQVFDPKSLIIETHVPQQALRELRPGLLARVRSDAAPDVVQEGKVALVAPVVETDSGMVKVRLAVAAGDLARLGLFVSGRIVLEVKEGALSIPTKAIAYERERPYVYKVVPSGTDEVVPSGTPEVVTPRPEEVASAGSGAPAAAGDGNGASADGEGAAGGAAAAAPGSPPKAAGGGAAAPTPAWRVQRVYLREGLSSGDRVEVLPLESGDALKQGDLIVLVGLDRLRDGDPVQLESEGGGAAPAGEQSHGGN